MLWLPYGPRGRWATKPKADTVEVDWAHPLTRGLTVCFLFSGGVVRDLVGNFADPLPFYGNGGLQQDASFQSVADINGLSSGTALFGRSAGCRALAPAALRPNYSASVFWRGAPLPFQDSDAGIFNVCMAVPEQPPYVSYGLFSTGSAASIRAYAAYNPGQFVSISMTVPGGSVYVPLTAALTADAVGTTGLNLYANGVVDPNGATPFGGGGTTLAYLPTGALGIGRYSDTFRNAGVIHDVGYMWGDRVLTADEVAWLHREPYVLVRPRVQRRYFQIPAGGGGTTYTQALSGAVTFTGSTPKRTSKALSGGLSFTGGLSRTVRRTIIAALTSSGSLSRSISRSLVAALTFSGSTTKTTSKSAFTAAVTFVGSMVTAAVHLKALSAALTFVGVISKQTNMPLSGSLSFTGGLSRIISRTLTAAIANTGNLAKRTSKTAFTASVSFVGAMTTAAVHLVSLVASLSFAGALSRRTNKSLTGSLSFTGGIARLISRSLTATLAPTGSISKRTSRSLSGSVSFVGSWTGAITGAIAKVIKFINDLFASTDMINPSASYTDMTGDAVQYSSTSNDSVQESE